MSTKTVHNGRTTSRKDRDAIEEHISKMKADGFSMEEITKAAEKLSGESADEEHRNFVAKIWEAMKAAGSTITRPLINMSRRAKRAIAKGGNTFGAWINAMGTRWLLFCTRHPIFNGIAHFTIGFTITGAGFLLAGWGGYAAACLLLIGYLWWQHSLAGTYNENVMMENVRPFVAV